MVFADLGGVYRLHLVLTGLAAWTLLEYLVHRFAFHWHPTGQRLHQRHHDQPGNLEAERSSLSTPLLALPIGFVLIVSAGVKAGSAVFAGLLLGYLTFIALHHVVHRCQIDSNSWLYSAKMRHLIHHRLENCNFGVTTGFWDIVFGTSASVRNKA
jgi:sterol desaturase/sphingolipid hydroxylase (fatty acid hydroxylase superfamily)